MSRLVIRRRLVDARVDVEHTDEMTEATTPRERAVEVGGVSLHVVSWGELTGPDRAVILVHGLTASSREFFDLGPALASAGWYTIAPDLRGRGRSGKPAMVTACRSMSMISSPCAIGLTSRA